MVRVQYTMLELPKSEWDENFKDSKDVGIPRYFYWDAEEGVIRVWPKPEPGTHFGLSAHVPRSEFKEAIKDG